MMSLLVLVLVIGAIFLSAKIKIRFFTWKSNALIAGIYLVCLLAFLPVYYFLPRPAPGLTADNAAPMFNRSDPGEVEQYIARGDLTQLKGVYENSSRAIKIKGNKLGFAISSSEYNYVYVARKNEDDGIIDVATYTTTSEVNGIDFSQQIAPPDISLQNNTLLIKDGKPQHLDFASFQPDFPLTQFKEDNQGSHGNINLINAHGSSMSIGWKFVWVRVPKNIEVEKGKANIKIIGSLEGNN